MGRSPVTIVAELRLKSDCIEQGRRDLITFAEAVRQKERKCLSIEVAHDLDDQTRIALIEKWTDRAAYEGPHLQTAHMKKFVDGSRQYFDGPAYVVFYESASGDSAAVGSFARQAVPYGR